LVIFGIGSEIKRGNIGLGLFDQSFLILGSKFFFAVFDETSLNSASFKLGLAFQRMQFSSYEENIS